jgi:hypothetical protein
MMQLVEQACGQGTARRGCLTFGGGGGVLLRQRPIGQEGR